MSNLLHSMDRKFFTGKTRLEANSKGLCRFSATGQLIFIFLLTGTRISIMGAEHKRAGTEEFSFMASQSLAAPAGLAGAYTGYGEGLMALSINPSGLAAAEGNSHSSLSFKKHIMDVNSGEVSHVFTRQNIVYAVSLEYMSYGSISQVDEENKSSGQDIYPMSSNPSFAMAAQWREKFRFGGSFQLPMEYLGTFAESQTALGWGFDLGMQYLPNNKRFLLGASLLNLGRQELHQLEGHASGGLLPLEFRAGLAYKGLGNRQTTGVFDIAFPYHNFAYLNAGVEHNVSRGFTVRAGTRWNFSELESYMREFVLNRRVENPGSNALKLAAGASLDQKSWGLDYAAQYWHNLGMLHFVTLRVRW